MQRSSEVRQIEEESTENMRKGDAEMAVNKINERH